MKAPQALKIASLLFAALIEAIPGRAQPVTKIATGPGSWHSLFLKADNSLWGMGYNPFGQLGDGTTNNVNYPEQIVASDVIGFSAAKHTLILKSDGSLWVTGLNTSGQLGIGIFSPYTNNGISHPEQIVPDSVVEVSAG